MGLIPLSILVKSDGLLDTASCRPQLGKSGYQVLMPRRSHMPKLNGVVIWLP